MVATASQTAKAQQMLEAIKAGQTVFTHAASGWMIVGPAADIRTGAIVTVTKANGDTSRVIVDAVTTRSSKQGIDYHVAAFRNAPRIPAARRSNPQVTRRADDGEWVTTTVHSDGAHVTTGGGWGKTITFD